MSIEGLLSEVSGILSSRLTIKAADQAFFGGKQVYTNVSLASTSAEGGKADAKQEKKDKKKGGKGADELGDAIKSAQNTIDRALAGDAIPAAPATDGKACAEIAALKKENQEIKKEVAELRKLIEALSLKVGQVSPLRIPSQLPFASSKRILILGDGNLSFSVSLSQMYPKKAITASVLEDESLFIQRYHQGQENIALLRSFKNVELCFETDATALPEKWKNQHDTIIMNFPHPGGKTNLKRSRTLIRGIFRCLSNILTEEALFHLALANGQSGLSLKAEEFSISPPEHRLDSWQIHTIAAEEGFQLQEILPMRPEHFPGYSSSGFRSTTAGFNNYDSAQRLVFKKYEKSQDYGRLFSFPTRRFFSKLRPFFVRDISFLFACEASQIEADEAKLIELLYKFGGGTIIAIQEVPELRSICPDPLLPNRIYRIFYQTQEMPLTRMLCNQLDEILRLRVQQEAKETELSVILT